MNERVKKQRELLLKGDYRSARDRSKLDISKITDSHDLRDGSLLYFREVVAHEQPLFHGDDLFGFNAYREKTPISKY